MYLMRLSDALQCLLDAACLDVGGLPEVDPVSLYLF